MIIIVSQTLPLLIFLERYWLTLLFFPLLYENMPDKVLGGLLYTWWSVLCLRLTFRLYCNYKYSSWQNLTFALTGPLSKWRKCFSCSPSLISTRRSSSRSLSLTSLGSSLSTSTPAVSPCSPGLFWVSRIYPSSYFFLSICQETKTIIQKKLAITATRCRR